MKKVIYLFVLAAFLSACNSEPRFVIKGKISGSDSVTFLLQKRDAGKIVTIDSSVVKKGSFKMKGKVAYPELVQLIALNTPYRTSFYLENSEISVTGKLDSLFNAKVTGSRTQDEYNSLIESTKPLSEKYSGLVQEYQAARQVNDTAKMSQIERAADDVSKEMSAAQKAFIKNNPSSFVTPSILRSLSYEMEAGEIEAAINAMDTSVSKIPVVQELKVRLEAMKRVATGQKAPDFTLNDVNGNPVSLSSKIGSKLLLVDFWAAWCGPCRQENPNVVKVYNEFKNKGFDVFGVSLDQSKDDWVKAIADDKLTWTHVSDLKYWSSDAAKLYAVNSIPANFLLDETGTIIGRNLRGNDLREKVKELLSN
ncbi:MAG TPA: TlpA disulfide reductase family protein [Bacteroidales bacterium]|nr:TlpA disulfide reductase family protein [Bacteroidales bacterium]HOX75593.1 TlpA disulfide reductase family protein [Bacteroidales bacterium]HPM86438.1 TlpA disulfide reductase family protein [Bacteroidales bacterium]HQM68183.1 TlpA disulfide reductase family protein [Bacteroidales bacterium]